MKLKVKKGMDKSGKKNLYKRQEERIQTHVGTMREMIKLHINHGSVDSFGGSRETHGTFHAITGTHAAVYAAKANLTYLDGTFPSRGGGINVGLSRSEYFDVVTGDT